MRAKPSAEQQIYRLLKSQPKMSFGSAELAKRFHISRQQAAKCLGSLLDHKKIYKTGSTRSAKYSLSRSLESSPTPTTLKLIKKINGLEEDRVLKELSLKLDLKNVLSTNSFQIFSYAFTEMLNNAIDHSRSSKVEMLVKLDRQSISFDIRDFGIGIFENVKNSFKLQDHFIGAEHVLKGKQSTDPKRHSGQGIYFTSRIADSFSLAANKLKIRIQKDYEDFFVSSIPAAKGSSVEFSISKQSKKSLKKLFENFSNEDLEFDKGHVRIRLTGERELLSRSQAKRILMGLDKYKRLEFDFSNIKEVGQAFTDEIFRIFARNHPEILLLYTNASSAVAFMIERARRG